MEIFNVPLLSITAQTNKLLLNKEYDLYPDVKLENLQHLYNRCILRITDLLTHACNTLSALQNFTAH